MTIELVHLADARIKLREPIVIPDTPLGTRMIFEVESAEFEGERLKGAGIGFAGADWATVDARGVVTLDVRGTFQTHDGAVIFTSYRGRVAPGGAVIAAPMYDTGDERYLWLNTIQAVAKGTLEGTELHYEIYEAR